MFLAFSKTHRFFNTDLKFSSSIELRLLFIQNRYHHTHLPFNRLSNLLQKIRRSFNHRSILESNPSDNFLCSMQTLATWHSKHKSNSSILDCCAQTSIHRSEIAFCAWDYSSISTIFTTVHKSQLMHRMLYIWDPVSSYRPLSLQLLSINIRICSSWHRSNKRCVRSIDLCCYPLVLFNADKPYYLKHFPIPIKTSSQVNIAINRLKLLYRFSYTLSNHLNGSNVQHNLNL